MSKHPFKIFLYLVVLLFLVLYLVAESMIADVFMLEVQGTDSDEITRNTVLLCMFIINAFTAAVAGTLVVVRLFMLFKNMLISELPKGVMIFSLLLIMTTIIAGIVKYSYIIKFSSSYIEDYIALSYIPDEALKLFILIDIAAGVFIALCSLAIFAILKFTVDVCRTDFSSFEEDLIDYIKQLRKERKDIKTKKLEKELFKLKHDL